MYRDGRWETNSRCVLRKYHVAAGNEETGALDALGRAGDRLVIPFAALQTLGRPARAVMVRWTGAAKHLPDAEPGTARDVRARRRWPVRFEMRVDRRNLGRDCGFY